MKNSHLFLLLICLLPVLLTCKKESQDSDVPNTVVDFTIYLTLPQYSSLNTVGNWVYITAGVRGIIVYHRSHGDFVALERNCTYQSSNANAVVSVDSSNVFAADTSCGSSFYLTDGSVANGPATVPLKRYNTSYNASSMTVHIYN
jgi:nitrite reductase/ring-hydroxylating ferredoxin subunit